MQGLRVTIRLLPAVLVLGCFAPRLAWAEWPATGRALSTAIKDQERPKAVTDGANGAIVVWQDARDPRVNVFARRVLASGELDPAWPVDGIAVLADSTALDTAFDGQQFPVIVSDGAGGAIVAWEDGRSQANNRDIFAQHILSSGVVDPAWPANGRALCLVRGDQSRPTIVADGAGGAIVTWMDGRSSVTDLDIYAQHVLASSVVDPAWPVNGTALCIAPSQQIAPVISSDGSGGAIVAWTDFRPSASSTDVYAQHVKSSGLVDSAWPVNGLALSRAPDTQLDPSILSDGQHGAIVAWEDFRNSTRSHIFAQRVLDTGAVAPGWPVDGLAVCTAPVEQVAALVASDGASGAIVTWLDDRNNLNHRPFAQHVLASGVVDPNWTVNGRALTQSSGDEESASIIPDGAGGAIVAWAEDSSFVFANHIQASGALDPTFPGNGRMVRPLPTFQETPALVSSGNGGGIVAWSDAVPGQDFDIYAMIVVTGTIVSVDPGTPGTAITFAPSSPNPARESVRLSFFLPRAAAVRLTVYDVAGRRVRELLTGTQPAGRHDIAWDLRDESGRQVSAGVSFARLEVEGRALTQRLASLR